MANQFMFGTPTRFERTSKFRPESEGVLDVLRQLGISGMQQNQPDFAPIEKHARTQFQQETLPSIAQRFTSMGAQRSSGFGDALSRAGEGLDTNLAAMKSQFDMQGRDQLMKMLGIGLTPRDEIGHFGGRQGFMGQAGAGLAQGLGKLLPVAGKAGLGYAFGGAPGALAALSPDAINSLMQLFGMNKGGQEQDGGSIQFNPSEMNSQKFSF